MPWEPPRGPEVRRDCTMVVDCAPEYASQDFQVGSEDSARTSGSAEPSSRILETWYWS